MLKLGSGWIQQRDARRLVGLGLVLLLGACRPAAATTPEAAVPTLVPTAVAVATASPTTGVSPLPPTNTPIPSPTLSPSPGPSPTASRTPLPSPTFTATPIPSETPTSVPQYIPALADYTPFVPEGATATATPPTPIPTAVPTFEVPRGTTNVLLIGADNPNMGGGVQRSDTLIIVSINRQTETAAMLSLPRDLYVYIPGWTMNRINTALAHGQVYQYPGAGPGLLKDTILYNFGIPIHYYAQVDFGGFQQIVDALGGIEVAVGCSLTDWRLKSPELNPNDEDNWERFTLDQGIHRLDGDLALWYVRSRLSTSDWSRGRRQQQVLRAMLNQGVDLGLLSRAPELYNTYRDAVETDMDIGRILQLAALAPAVRANGVEHLYLAGKTRSWEVPVTGAQIQLPIWEGRDMMAETFQRLYLPPSLTRATRAPILVEVVSASRDPQLVRLAAENLSWYGFAPVINETSLAPQDFTEVTYHGTNFKGAYEWLISWVMGVRRDRIALASDTTSDYDYRVVVGDNYNPCLNQLFAPKQFLTEAGS